MSIVSNMIIGTEQYLIKDYYSGFGALNYAIQTVNTSSIVPINPISSYNNSNMITIQNGIIIKYDCLLQITLYGKLTLPNNGGGGILYVLKNGSNLKGIQKNSSIISTLYASMTIVTVLKANDKLTVGYTLTGVDASWSEIQLSALTLSPDLAPVPAMAALSEGNDTMYVLNYNGDSVME